MNARPTTPHRVAYWSVGTPELYALLRRACPPSLTLRLLETGDDAERRAALADADAVVVAATPLTEAQLDAAGPRLRLVQHQGVGWQDTVAWRAVARRGIPLATTPQGTTLPVAEHAVLLALAALRRLPYADNELRAGRWHVNALRPVSRNLAGMRVGYVGFGRIGQATAARFRAFGTTGLYSDPLAPPDPGRDAALGVAPAPLDALLGESDLVTLHLPVTDATRNLIDAAAIARMKPGAVLVNTARGGLVDETALADALRGGHLLAAGLDVLSQEPPPRDHPLLALPNIVLTPHISAGTRDAFEEKLSAALGNIAHYLDGGELENRVKL